MARDSASVNNATVRPGGPTTAEMLAEQLKLTKEQREQVQKILIDTAKELLPLRTQIEQMRAEIVGSIINGDAQNEIKKGTDALGAAEVQLTGIETRSFAQVCALLKPNQQSRAAAAFDLWTSVLDPPGGSGRGGFNAGGRRGKN